MSDQSGPEPGAARKRDWVEIVAVVLLALAAVATAWSSYQATRWHGEQAKASGRTNNIRIQAARAESLGEAENEIDVATFIQWINARAREEPELADFYAARFRPEFEPTFNAWIATNPFTDPDAPLTPFMMQEYRLDADAQAEQLDQEAEESSANVRRSIQRASNYVLAVVVFSVALFFAGMSTKLETPGGRKVLLVVGCTLFLGAVAWVATFPVSISISG
jgi:ferric-dicitrate binding protein FerR (iron transport regulator)